MKINFSFDPSVLDSTFFKNIAWGWCRHAIGGAGMFLVGQGLMSGHGWTDLYGAGAFVFSIGWSAFDKYVRTGEVFGKPVPKAVYPHGRP